MHATPKLNCMGRAQYVTRFAKNTRTVSRHTFHRHLFATSMHQQHKLCVYYCWKLNSLLSLRPFSQACLVSTSARVTFKWPHLPLTSRQPAVNHHTTGWWVWPWIELLCVTCGGENGTNGSHLAIFNQNIAFALHFVATRLPLTLPPYRSASAWYWLCQQKNYLKWWEIQLAIQCTVDTMNYFE